MKYLIGILIAGACIFSCIHTANAQTSLPPEARAQILILDIDKSIGRKDFVGALKKIQELDSVGVQRPSSLYITEAKLAGQAKDYPRARAALEKYFKAANANDANYKEAVSIYSALGDIEAKAKASAEAAEIAAWQAARASDSCASYLTYLKAPGTTGQNAEQALTKMDSLACAMPSYNEVAQSSYPALGKKTEARRLAEVAARGRQFEAAARAAKIEGRWGQIARVHGEIVRSAQESCTKSPMTLSIANGAVRQIDPGISDTELNIIRVESQNVQTELYGLPNAQFERKDAHLYKRYVYSADDLKKGAPQAFFFGGKEYFRPDGSKIIEAEYLKCS